MIILFWVTLMIGVLGFVGLWVFNNWRRFDFFRSKKNQR